MSSYGIDRTFSAETALLDYADILRTTSALIAEEKKRVPTEDRPAFERQVATHMNEVALCLRDMVLNLGKDIGTYNRRQWQDSKKRWHPLRARSERAIREVEFWNASEPIEIQETLNWMMEQGQSEELDILRRAGKTPLILEADDKTRALIDLTEKRIERRIPRISHMVSNDEFLWRSLASFSLGRFTPSKQHNFQTHDIQRAFLEALHDSDPSVRREAAGVLGKRHNEDAVIPLMKLLSGPMRDENDSVRRACIGALGQIGGPTAVRAIIAAAEQDPAEAVRRDAIYALIELSTFEEQDAYDSIEQEVLQAMKRVSRNPKESEFLKDKAQSLVVALTQPT